jgi:hypothetical protein
LPVAKPWENWCGNRPVPCFQSFLIPFLSPFSVIPCLFAIFVFFTLAASTWKPANCWTFQRNKIMPSTGYHGYQLLWCKKSYVSGKKYLCCLNVGK